MTPLLMHFDRLQAAAFGEGSAPNEWHQAITNIVALHESEIPSRP